MNSAAGPEFFDDNFSPEITSDAHDNTDNNDAGPSSVIPSTWAEYSEAQPHEDDPGGPRYDATGKQVQYPWHLVAQG